MRSVSEPSSYADHFSIKNLPFGIGNNAAHPERTVVTRLGDEVVFLDVLADNGLLSALPEGVLATFSQSTLNPLTALPKTFHLKIRSMLQTLLSKPLSSLPLHSTNTITSTIMHLPLSIGDFTDFSCSREHVLNAGEAIMGKRFLPPGFLHFPIGYTGRSSSIVVSDTPIVRPKGQFRDAESEGEVLFGPTKQMDYELEVACVVGKPSMLGSAVTIAEADEHIFGLVLLNDWSARDIQALEMTPLGPLSGKSFCTTISPWVITLAALSPFAIPSPPRSPPPPSYLMDPESRASTYAITLCAELLIPNENNSSHTSTQLCTSQLSSMYWTFRDLVTQQTCNGCPLRTGDLLATGTISGEEMGERGCLLELTEGGRKAFVVDSGNKESGGERQVQRMWLEDGDAVRITGHAGDGVGFGECVGVVVKST